MTSLEQAGVVTLSDHFQLKIELVNSETQKLEVFYVYIKDVERVIACPPWYAKVFKV